MNILTPGSTYNPSVDIALVLESPVGGNKNLVTRKDMGMVWDVELDPECK